MAISPQLPPISVTRHDYDRLSVLASTATVTMPMACELLAAEIHRASLVESREVAPTVVTMNSEFDFRDEQSGRVRRVTLVYPDGADIADGTLSILTPVGMALLGLSAGQSIEWRMHDGRLRRLTVLRIHFQPEAAGRYDL